MTSGFLVKWWSKGDNWLESAGHTALGIAGLPFVLLIETLSAPVTWKGFPEEGECNFEQNPNFVRVIRRFEYVYAGQYKVQHGRADYLELDIPIPSHWPPVNDDGNQDIAKSAPR
jgi:hypothetical protein